MNTLTETQKAYIAGFIDGEGCIRISKKKSSNKAYPFDFQRWVIVTNTELNVLSQLKQITGIGTIYVYKKFPKAGRGKWKPCHRWQIVSKQAEDLLKAIYPYLVVKKHLAEEVLSAPLKGKGHTRTKEEYQEQMKFFQHIKELNRRGIVP